MVTSMAIGDETAPADATLPERAVHGPQPGDRIPSHFRWCFGCGSDHPTGLHMELFAGSGLDTYGTFIVSDHHQGAPGLAHGGLLTTAMDEVFGSLNWLLAKPAVTAHLECDFRRPVPVGSKLEMRAMVQGVKGRRVHMSGEAMLAGKTAVTARAIFVQVPLEHFLDHGNADQVQQAIRERGQQTGIQGPGVGEIDVQVNP
nr:PaaI family thioesterase [Candidatus Nanopelagicales bacterium]